MAANAEKNANGLLSEVRSEQTAGEVSEPPVAAYEWDCLLGKPLYDGSYPEFLECQSIPAHLGSVLMSRVSVLGYGHDALHALVVFVGKVEPETVLSGSELEVRSTPLTETETAEWGSLLASLGLALGEPYQTIPGCVFTYEEKGYPGFCMLLSLRDVWQLRSLANEHGYFLMFDVHPAKYLCLREHQKEHPLHALEDCPEGSLSDAQEERRISSHQ